MTGGEYAIVLMGLGIIIGVPCMFAYLYAVDAFSRHKHSNRFLQEVASNPSDIPFKVSILLLVLFSFIGCGFIERFMRSNLPH